MTRQINEEYHILPLKSLFYFENVKTYLSFLSICLPNFRSTMHTGIFVGAPFVVKRFLYTTGYPREVYVRRYGEPSMERARYNTGTNTSIRRNGGIEFRGFERFAAQGGSKSLK